MLTTAMISGHMLFQEKISTPMTEGMLENLMGVGDGGRGVNGSGNPDGTLNQKIHPQD